MLHKAQGATTEADDNGRRLLAGLCKSRECTAGGAVRALYLVASLAMAWVEPGRLVQIGLACRRVQAGVAALAQVSHLIASG